MLKSTKKGKYKLVLTTEEWETDKEKIVKKVGKCKTKTGSVKQNMTQRQTYKIKQEMSKLQSQTMTVICNKVEQGMGITNSSTRVNVVSYSPPMVKGQSVNPADFPP